MQLLGKLLIWATIPWCGFIGAVGLRGEDGSALAVLMMIAVFGWIPWIAGRVLTMIAQRRRTPR